MAFSPAFRKGGISLFSPFSEEGSFLSGNPRSRYHRRAGSRVSFKMTAFDEHDCRRA
ncbi:hypothetical protein B4135_3543 [Caldibacillus debilis]|uniref:Uncharacterized protein n=1 Tax=Caldibacillus debilis TaxID=301148 RepID=A0A150LDF0_9BACI|nr:hypothetical protein B4135_3543 [Caldibacillus debilis]